MQNLKAIETVYKGYAFRSRLEARYAVFLDGLGVPYDYEPEGFALAGINYLPDFRLTKARCWLEVKGQMPNEDEIEKAKRLANATGWPVFIVWGDPVSTFVLSDGGILLITVNRTALPQPEHGASVNFLWLVNFVGQHPDKLINAALAARQRRFEER